MNVAATLTFALASLALADDRDRPPPLTFDKHVDYIAWYNDFVSEGKSDNAYELYKGLYPDENGQGGFPQPEEAIVKEVRQLATGPVWTASEHPELAAYLKQCAPYLQSLKEATERPHYWQPVPSDTETLFEVAMPILPSSRECCRAMLAQSWMRRSSQATHMIETWRDLLQHADHLKQGDWLISNLVSAAVCSYVYQAATAAVHEGVLGRGDFVPAFKTLEAYDKPPTHLSRPYLIEWAHALQVLQFLFPKGSFSLANAASLEKTTQVDVAFATAFSDPRRTATLIDHHYGGLAEIASRPPGLENVRRFTRFEDESQDSNKNNAFCSLFLGSLARSYQGMARNEAQRRGTLLTLALHAHHTRHGKWPDSLKKIDRKLGLKDLKKLWKDPFSGKYFKYKLKDGQPLLYSVGFDGKDDGGRHDKRWGESDDGGDYVFWPYQSR